VRAPVNAAMAARLEGKFGVNHETGCWIWQRARSVHGYGAVGVGLKVWRAHRVAYEAWVGPIPQGMAVLHACDNPPCINPDHLVVGTKAQNSADMVRKGRSASGERHSQATLTTAQVHEIRRLWGQGRLSQVEIGRRFGVRGSTISRILSGKRWGGRVAC
jgi:hypothetical protein